MSVSNQSKRIVRLPIAGLKETFHVRTSLNDDRVIYFGELYSNRTPVDPIKVVEGTNEIVDGRHRKAGALLANYVEIDCELVPKNTRPHLIMAAFAANLGGSLPPSRQDIGQTLRLLLEEKVSRKEIIAMMRGISTFPDTLIASYLDKVQSDMASARLNKAVDGVVTGNMTVAMAAEAFSVNAASIQAAISNKRSRKPDLQPIHQVKAGFSKRLLVVSTQMSLTNKKLLQAYRDGIVNERQMEEHFDHMNQLLTNLKTSHENWKNRYEVAKKDEGTDTTKASPAKPVEKVVKKATPAGRPGSQALSKMGLV